MIIVAGDSFVYGSELKDPKNTFASLLAPDSKCIAWPGFSNDAIARTTIERCEQGDVSGVLVSWTFPSRFEFRFNYDTKQKKSPWYTITPWTAKDDIASIQKEFVTQNDSILRDQMSAIERARKLGMSDFAKNFYAHVGNSEYWEVYTSIKEILYLQQYLTVKGIPYMFTCADNCLFENYTIRNIDSILASIYNQIDRSKWFLFDAGTGGHETHTPRGFYQWAVESKFPIGTTHPLEEAHAEAAKLMQDKFNELVTKNIQ